MRLTRFSIAILIALVLGLLVVGAGGRSISASSPPAPATMAQLWAGKARFVRIGTLDWHGAKDEQAGSFVVDRGVWYVFNRASALAVSSDCQQDRARMVARSSRDQGRTWSDPVTVAEPGDGPGGVICAVLDGSAVFDSQSGTWHLLAQCLGVGGAGWSLCHYTRRSASPLGRFVTDTSNPVVKGGMLWSRLCAGPGKTCPTTTRDEGTPDIAAGPDGSFFVTFHGFDPISGQGFRGVVTTQNFRDWRLTGPDLPNDAMLGPDDCKAWLTGCAGVGEATSIDDPDGRYRYTIAETITKSLLCTPGQQWRFELLRSAAGPWPRSGNGEWQRLPQGPLVTTAYPSSEAVCPVQYARLFRDGGKIYLVYEDWNRAQGTVDRPLLTLVGNSE
ncbi:hypothetical protein NS277_15680 [Novosphingobium barchaimii]|nr:hypothetical protein NS277_15680 [Novosphingobium barchaimii]